MNSSELEQLMQEIKAVRYEYWPLDQIIPYENNPRKNDHVVEKMVKQIKQFGMPIPICIRPDGTIADGHLRYKAAKAIGLSEIPVAINKTWTEAQVKAFRISVNKSAEWADWDFELLPLELEDLQNMGFDMELTGFTPAELNQFVNNPNVVNNPKDEYTGMPEFDQKDKTAFRSIIVHFKDQEAVDEFTRVVYQNITPKTKMIWFPEIEIETAADKRYANES